MIYKNISPIILEVTEHTLPKVIKIKTIKLSYWSEDLGSLYTEQT